MSELLFDECKVWQACRATSAATTFFDPITFGKYGQTFVDGGVLYNNPIQLVHREARQLWPDREILMTSIGTGSAPGKAFQGNLKAIIESMTKILTQTERTANDFHQSHPEMVNNKSLFRFNVFHGLADIGLEEYKE
ncbi:MAG: patatin-like phospholipase family protein, partial [Candidatus Saccharimonadales bacterium]